MPDIVDKETRSRMMAGIRGQNTHPERAIRKGLHARGFRFRLHAKEVPGKPDLVLPRFRAAVFVNGCFWHGHHCHLFRLPSTRPDFWEAKIARNCQRDADVRHLLQEQKWRVLTVWECALKGRWRLDFDEVVDRAGAWITGTGQEGEIQGKKS